jgi:Skp family chaperone for outer membrane proteins
MFKLIKYIFLIFTYSLILIKISYSSEVTFVDFSKVLNKSIAGAAAQDKLKVKFESENKKFIAIEENLKKQETELIAQKKVLSNDEYKKKLDNLRSKVSELQKNKQESLNNIAKSRNKARQNLLQSVNPIIQKYMEQNNIKIVVDKQSVVLGDKNLEITDKIIEILNQEIKSINLE